ncbi:hypothetical protein ACLB1T_27255 [Escherichia coli]
MVMRIMCRRGFEMDFAELLLEDYKASLKYLSDYRNCRVLPSRTALNIPDNV